MRKAAAIILMVQGAVILVGALVGFVLFGLRGGAGFYAFGHIFSMICGAFVVTGGVYCLKRRHWGACLVSGLILVLLRILPVLEELGRGSPLLRVRLMDWVLWIVVGAAVVPIIFIIRRKKEWPEISHPDAVGRI